MEYTILYHRAEEGGYWIEVPALPGCYSLGETMEDAIINIKEAIELHLAALKEESLEIPVDADIVIGRNGISQLA